MVRDSAHEGLYVPVPVEMVYSERVGVHDGDGRGESVGVLDLCEGVMDPDGGRLIVL